MADRARIFVSQPIRAEGLALLEEVGRVEVAALDRMQSRDELLAALSRADYVLCIGDVGLDGEMLRANPHLKGIACAYRDPEGWIDLKVASALKIPVSGISSATYTTICRSTADLTVALLLSLAWRIPDADRHTRCGKFRQEQTTHFTCTSLTGKTFGMVGLGGVGRFVVPRVQPFDLDVIYTKRIRLEPTVERSLGVTWVPTLSELLGASDFVSIHARYDQSSHKLIGESEFELMKPTAFLINTARGRILDELALIQQLRAGKLAGAGLDVYWGEPPVTEYPSPNPELFKLDNVVLTPHIGGQTEASLIGLARNSAENLAAMVKGQQPPDLVNAEVYK